MDTLTALVIGWISLLLLAAVLQISGRIAHVHRLRAEAALIEAKATSQRMRWVASHRSRRQEDDDDDEPATADLELPAWLRGIASGAGIDVDAILSGDQAELDKAVALVRKRAPQLAQGQAAGPETYL